MADELMRAAQREDIAAIESTAFSSDLRSDGQWGRQLQVEKWNTLHAAEFLCSGRPFGVLAVGLEKLREARRRRLLAATGFSLAIPKIVNAGLSQLAHSVVLPRTQPG
ncbi:hypothetical protein EOA23_16330 [Mesorhizobium sp. M2A.F.Ca.ET.042.01.1.1]|uniref:hypothetical protein n=1 Tax=Mesorhizobium sp. M2A.F.Ca.ET.042.01.1.1 TaxID=2496745 RepID=UPI000FCC687D|nr:hypothetical protein [Mesorhizobium sp. M2A.F.Ca.ET.042.01.1.1]RUX27811.1 hypothetical protein EOA23_16330 [Mesorhizobium sp. M2A.F.Ca.ET.042.01.1.1]